METTEDIVTYVREWSIERISNKKMNIENSKAIFAEFYEWIEPKDDDVDILSIVFEE